jgi:hypothetical protein
MNQILPPTKHFTIAEISAATGISRQAVKMALLRVTPDTKIVSRLSNGHLADAWKVDHLPARFIESMSRIASRKGYRSLKHLLSDPPKRWKPRLPLSQISTQYIDRATRLQRALRLALALQSNEYISDEERARRGFEEFRREFRNTSQRHFRRLLNRTIDRDAGEDRFDDVAIYLDDSATPAPDGAKKPVVQDDGQRRLVDYLSNVKDPRNPTIAERDLIWVVACEVLQESIDAQKKQKPARREIVEILAHSHVNLARNTDALKLTFKRKFERWIAGGMNLPALQDSRPKASGNFRAPEIPEDDKLKLLGHARINCGGRVSQAWRELMRDGQLSDVLLTNHIANPTSKSYVPTRIRNLIAPDVKRLEAIHHGPREHKLRGAYHTRDWSTVAAGDWLQSDDVTAPVYFWTQTAKGIELMRGQFLPMIDERTTFILGFVLILERNYNSLSIRSLITRVCSEHGLPRHGFSFERGIWKSSKILTGSTTAVPWEVADTGLRGLGLRFRHANLPRGKVIENTIGLMQNQMERLPGYCGRDEKNDKYERLQRAKLDVESGRVPADKVFLSEAEICEEYFKICEEFNDTPQQGRKLNGLSPREGWTTLQSTPLTQFDERCLHLLAHDRRKVKIGGNGITISVGKQRFNYKGEETGRRQGQEVLAWFNPDVADVLPCTDLEQCEVFTVPRSNDLPAVGATPEQFAQEEGLIAQHNGYATRMYRIVKNALPRTSYRQNFVDKKTAHIGEQITAQREQHTERVQLETKQRRTVATKAASVGIPAAIINHRSGSANKGLDMMLEAMKRRKAAVTEETSQPAD